MHASNIEDDAYETLVLIHNRKSDVLISVSSITKSNVGKENSPPYSKYAMTNPKPHFEGNLRSPLTLSKMGVWSPLGLPKTQKTISGVKTPCIEVFFIPLESS
jgi:hypothetical protein